ncbi:peptidase C14, caspase domain-containing protein [Armillaria fumosa]|nr:peptidase C14, caspase domain-containing protein [Armillaria fumosa]
MEDYLINNLEVPKDHIRRLLCPHNDPSPNDSGDLVPTRANIVNALLDLARDTRIQLGDNIIIYFSGHGASYECHNHKDDPHQICLCGIEAMCPSDRNTMDASNNPITDITDREFNTILTQICRAKGRKITVILDCCFSASLARAPGVPARILEGVRFLPPSRLQQAALGDALRTADNIFKSLGLPEYRCILDKEWRPDMESHIVLAACSEHEFAREVKGSAGNINGAFTQALLQVLKSDLKGGETYKTLLSLLTISSETRQTPVVAGTHMNELLWQ